MVQLEGENNVAVSRLSYRKAFTGWAISLLLYMNGLCTNPLT